MRSYMTPKNPPTSSTSDASLVTPEANRAECVTKVSAELTPGVALVARSSWNMWPPLLARVHVDGRWVCRRDHYWRRVHENSTALTGRAIVTERAMNVATERCQAEHVRLRSLQKELSALPIMIAALKDTAVQLGEMHCASLLCRMLLCYVGDARCQHYRVAVQRTSASAS